MISVLLLLRTEIMGDDDVGDRSAQSLEKQGETALGRL